MGPGRRSSDPGRERGGLGSLGHPLDGREWREAGPETWAEIGGG